MISPRLWCLSLNFKEWGRKLDVVTLFVAKPEGRFLVLMKFIAATCFVMLQLGKR